MKENLDRETTIIDNNPLDILQINKIHRADNNKL